MSDPKWLTDRSRFLDGFNCEWKRLLRFHAFDTGFERSALYAPLATGISVHAALETILKHKASTREEVSNLISVPLDDYVKANIDTAFENPLDDIRQQVSIVEALAHAYTRITIPWIYDNFEIVDVEADQAVELPGGILWRARPDFVTRAKPAGRLAIHDFKSAAYWSDPDHDQWRDSLQQMLNGYVASMVYGERVESYYIHILVKGTKKAPSYLTHPMYRPANPPIVKEDILPHWTSKKDYARVFAPYIPMLIPEWVWSMDAAYCAKTVPVVGPFLINYDKVERFLSGLPTNETNWMRKLDGLQWARWADPEFQLHLDRTFPRTYNCYEFGGRRCQFYGICHREAGWENPIASGLYHVRKPHHTIGEEGEDS